MSKVKGAISKKVAMSRSSNTAELLVEIGSEELPFESIAPALSSLKEQSERLLAESRLSYRSVRTYGTPRRLVLVVDELAAHQAATLKEAMGPSKTVAFDQTGQPTKAAIGFAAGQGVAVQDLQIRQTPKGEYVFAVKREEGRQARPVLTEIVPHIVAKLSFPKSMKWNESGARFARPVRWLVALYGGQIVPLQVCGIKAGNTTQGHRVRGKTEMLRVLDFSSYSRILERNGVLVDQSRRAGRIVEQLNALCKANKLKLAAENEDKELVDQAIFTTEYPFSIMGSFNKEYLEVPKEVLITSMKEHQGFFAVVDQSKKLAARFLAVANNQVKDMSLIREGNERVLAARLADAKFFFDEDRKTTLAARAKKLSGVVFHQKLGTMAQKQERVADLVDVLGKSMQLSEVLVRACHRAAELCKADLLSGVVGEFPKLQGIMGRYYAAHDGEDRDVFMAIGQHYRPISMEGAIPETSVAKLLSIADRLDTLAAFFHVGIVPTGSEDPFALRRHATAIVRILLEGAIHMNLGQAIQKARVIVEATGLKAAPVQSGDAQQRLTDFMFERVRHYVRTIHGLRDDVINAVLSVTDRQSFDLLDLVAKMQALEDVTTRQEFDPLIIGFKRAHRLVEKEQWNRQAVEEARFQHPAESALHKSVQEERGKVASLMNAGEYGKVLESLVHLKPTIDAFFAAVMVNAEDPSIRNNRLSLLKEVDDCFMSFADLSQIVVQGS